MSENTAAQTSAARTVATADHGKLDIQALVLLAVLLAAGFILNFTVGKAISGISGGLISPEFIISAFCLTILVVRPNIGQALVIGLISAAVIQVTTTSPFIDFAAEGIAAMLMALIVRVGMESGAKKAVPLIGSFVTTAVSGLWRIEMSWKLESSTTAASSGPMESISGSRGLPMFPPRWTRLPAAFKNSDTIVVVVVLPSLPVTAQMGQGQTSKNASISLVRTAPRSTAARSSGRSGRIPGVRKITSSRRSWR